MALVGFMGAGKSAVGRELAAALGMPFVDTDELVVAEAGPIADLFAERGEAGFRARRGRTVVTAAVAVAGRAAVRARPRRRRRAAATTVREALARLPHVVWLTAPPEVLWARVTATRAQAVRPLAADEPAFRELLAAREPLYREVATQVVETAGRSPAAVAAKSRPASSPAPAPHGARRPAEAAR